MDVDYYRVVLGKPVQWAEPDMDAAVEAMREVAEKRLLLRNPEHTQKIRKEFGWAEVGRTLDDAIRTFE